MKKAIGDLWHYSQSGPICIPTNGYITKKGAGVMGRGLALQAKDRYPDIVHNLGRHLQQNGNTVGWILINPIQIISIPVKPCELLLTKEEDRSNIIERMRYLYKLGDKVPGYHCKANRDLIRKSLVDLVSFISENGLSEVYLPLIGCGAGELDFKRDLVPILLDCKLPDSINLVFPEGN